MFKTHLRCAKVVEKVHQITSRGPVLPHQCVSIHICKREEERAFNINLAVCTQQVPKEQWHGPIFPLSLMVALDSWKPSLRECSSEGHFTPSLTLDDSLVLTSVHLQGHPLMRLPEPTPRLSPPVTKIVVICLSLGC